MIHTMTLDVERCTACGGSHGLVRFERQPGPERFFAGTCPATGQPITMNTRANTRAWEGLLAVAGVAVEEER